MVGPRFRAILALLLMISGTAIVSAQGTNGNGRNTQATGSPQLPQIIRDLLHAADPSTASLRADALRVAPGGRKEIQRLLLDPGLADHVLQGLLACLVEKNERSEGMVETLMRAFLEGAGARKERLRQALVSYHASGSILEQPLSQLRQAPNAAALASTAEIALVLACTDKERMTLARDLVQLLQSEGDPERNAVITGALRELTFHTYVTPESWAAWLVRFQKANPDGFSLRALAESAREDAARSGEQRWVDEALRAIRLLSEARVLPTDYLDVRRTPSVTVRKRAAERVAELSVNDAAKAAEAVKTLIASVESDPDSQVQHAALAGLGELALANPDLAPSVGAAVMSRLEDQNLETVRVAVLALRKCNHAPAEQALRDLYLGLRQGERAAETPVLRREVIAALAGLAGTDKVIAEALNDPDPSVRAAAANTLGALGRREHAARLAQVFMGEADEQVQQSLLGALNQLMEFGPPVVLDVMIKATEQGEETLRLGLEGLMLALSDPQWGVEADARVRASKRLVELYPQAIDRATRATLVARLDGRIPAGLAPTAAAWTVVEPDEAIRNNLVQGLIQSPEVTPKLLIETGLKFRELKSPLLADRLGAAVLARLEAGGARSPLTGEARVLRASALLDLGRAETLKEAEALLDLELQARPDDARVLRLRGWVRLRGERRREAIEDLRKAFDRDADALSLPELIDVTERLANLYTELGMPAEAVGVIARSGEARSARRVRYAEALANLALKNYRAAYGEAIALPIDQEGEPSEAKVLRLRVDSGLELPDPEAREQAILAYERLAELAPGDYLTVLEARTAGNRRARDLVARLDGEDAAAWPQLQRELSKMDPGLVAPWLVLDVDALANRGTAGSHALVRRLMVLRTLFPKSTDLHGFQTPENPTSLEQARNLAAQLEEWWKTLKR